MAVPQLWARGDQALGKDPPLETSYFVEENNSHCSSLPPPSGSSQPEAATLTDMVFLSVFKATPTLWQPMAAATPDLLLAMAISSQVSGFVSWVFGDTGGRLHWGEGGEGEPAHTYHTRPAYRSNWVKMQFLIN